MVKPKSIRSASKASKASKASDADSKAKPMKRRYQCNKMLTPSQLRNMVYDNTLQDWLERYHPDRKTVSERRYRNSRDFTKNFREYICKVLKERIGSELVHELERPDTQDVHDGEQMAKLLNGKQTLELMAKGIPVIANAQLINRSEAICDIADLIVRTDYLPILFPRLSYVPPGQCCRFSGQDTWHYIVVGVRFSQLQFCVDGAKIRNDNSVRYWKTKLFIQTRILNYYQQITTEPSAALLLGRGWVWTQSKAAGGATLKDSTFNKPGVVLFDTTFDRFVVDVVQEGDQWLEKLDAPLACEWTVAPKPSVPELYANAKLGPYDTPWHSQIGQIAIEQDDITRLHHCTVRNRKYAHDLGYFRLSDVPVADALGYKSSTNLGNLINRYLTGDWDHIANIPVRVPENPDSMVFLDFESMPVANVQFIDDTCLVNEWIYLVSVQVGSTHRQFGLTSLDAGLDAADRDQAHREQRIERSMAEQLFNLLGTIKDPVIYCWSDAEARYLYKLEAKYPEFPLGSNYAYRIVDLHEVFSENEIILPGQTDYTLSTVAKSMGLTDKVPVNTNHLVEGIMYSELKPKAKQRLLDQLLAYNRNDTTVLSEMVTKIMDSRN